MTNSELLNYLSSQAFKFWICPDCVGSTMIDWYGNVAKCRACGKTNVDRQSGGF